MTVGRLVRRGVRWLLGWWWQSARPSTGAALPDAGPARPEHETGRPPHPHERWRPTAPATGPWADVDPVATGSWPRRATLGVLAVWGAMVGWRVRRDLTNGR